MVTVIAVAFSAVGLPRMSVAVPPDDAAGGAAFTALADEFHESVRPLLTTFCLECHSTEVAEADLDLQRFDNLDVVRRDALVWQLVLEMLDSGAMPPETAQQPSDEQRRLLRDWVQKYLTAEARAHHGDPGDVPLRRLSNTEYNNTVRDLTGVDLQPAREFPADGAAGEGFTNAAEALSMSPAMMSKYLDAAKDIAAHAVLLPDGFRFSPSNTRRDWTDESLAELREFYAKFTSDREGRLPLRPYLTVLVRHRGDLHSGKTTLEEVAAQAKLSPKYLATLWEALNATEKASSYPLTRLRAQWREAEGDEDVAAMVADVAKWQESLWNVVRIGSYVNPDRQVAKDPEVVESREFRLQLEPAAGQGDMVLYLSGRELFPADGEQRGYVTWQRPRFEAGDQPAVLLRDYEPADNQAFRSAFDEDSLVVPLGEVVEVRVSADAVGGREFVVECRMSSDDGRRVVQLDVRSSPPTLDAPPDLQAPLLAAPDGPRHKRLLEGLAEFRRLFPMFVCYPHVIPLDEVVCLKSFHREDGPLERLFLTDQQKREIDQLWEHHRFITKSPVVENEYLPLFIGFVTQDQPKETLEFFEAKRAPFRERAEQFEREFEAAADVQLDKLCELAGQAYRRPLMDGEEQELRELYDSLRAQQVPHEEAIRGVLARVLVAPAFLLHMERSPAGDQPAPVTDWELASRLSYFLWASLPDDELRQAAGQGRLHDPEVLAAQTQRMLKDPRIRALAIEFGTQWIHVRGFDQFNEKSETLFPEFDADLRTAIYEESIRFFQDLFQNDRSARQILDADFTFLNERLAQHYGISGVAGPEWRRVEGVKQYGRGGILGLASVQTKQAGASRTSPVLRGNWVVETLLGEKLPRPPANVPQLPEKETGNDGLTMRQLVEQHVSVPECARCHERIDPFGFALEKYDPIGRLREKDLGGLPLDSGVTLKDGTQFEGIDGLRQYLLTKKRDVFLRSFSRKLLGYAMGRSVQLADETLIDEIVTKLKDADGRMSDAVLAIVQSPQFRMVRGAEQAP